MAKREKGSRKPEKRSRGGGIFNGASFEASRFLTASHKAEETLRAIRHESAQLEGAPVELDDDQLRAVQRQAVQLLASGMRVTEVARHLHVGRRTVHEWLRSVPEFKRAVAVEVARREHSIRSAAVAGYHSALDVLRDVLEHGRMGEKIQAAAIVLKHTTPVATREAVAVDGLRGEVQTLGRRVSELAERGPVVGANGSHRRF